MGGKSSKVNQSETAGDEDKVLVDACASMPLSPLLRPVSVRPKGPVGRKPPGRFTKFLALFSKKRKTEAVAKEAIENNETTTQVVNDLDVVEKKEVLTSVTSGRAPPPKNRRKPSNSKPAGSTRSGSTRDLRGSGKETTVDTSKNTENTNGVDVSGFVMITQEFVKKEETTNNVAGDKVDTFTKGGIVTTDDKVVDDSDVIKTGDKELESETTKYGIEQTLSSQEETLKITETTANPVSIEADLKDTEVSVDTDTQTREGTVKEQNHTDRS